MADESVGEFHDDELVAPQWLNAEFYKELLQKFENDKRIEILDVKLTPATLKGDHYASIMFRTAVTYQRGDAVKTKSLIIKTVPEEMGPKKEFLQELYLFETEIDIYNKVIPKFQQLFRNAGDQTILGPRCLYESLQPRNVIVFEDLVERGYAVLRERRPNMEEAEMIFLKLAKYHAASYKLLQEEPEMFQQFRYGVMNLPSIVKSDLMWGGIDKFIALLDAVPTLREYKPYFVALKADLITKCTQSFVEYWEQPKADTLYALCHGDVHDRNVMFKHNPITSKLEDVLLLDFQVAYVGPLVNGLIYACFIMVGADIRQHHFDELLYKYHKYFVDTLKQSGFDGQIPTLSDLHAQFVKQKHYEIFMLVTLFPLMIAFREKIIETELLMTSSEYRMTRYHNELFVKELHVLLPYYLHRGYFEA